MVATIRNNPESVLSAALLAAVAVLVGMVGAGVFVGEIRGAVVATLGGALATGLGAYAIFFVRRTSALLQDTLLGTGAGIMLAASIFSLLLPSLEKSTALVGPGWPAVSLVGAGLLFGGLFLWGLDRAVPHAHVVTGYEGPNHHQMRIRRIWLFVVAVTLHNIPEGLAVGVSYGAGDLGKAAALGIGIGFQDAPEGLVVALALTGIGVPAWRSALVGAASGAVEPLAGLIGAVLVGFSAAALPVALAVCAGAMLFVISHEIIPESHRQGHETPATFGLLAGFVAMMFLDVALA
ncbi:MAG TPA: ZIP family metal transporter [Fibrobacteria bacterium]|nr:ZIP family metal transporter [Fibrobacteria bacterium]